MLFSIIALGLSFPVQRGYLDAAFAALVGDTVLAGLPYLLAGFSTLTATLVGLAMHRGLPKTITVFGDDVLKNTAIGLLPVVAFALVGREKSDGINAWLYGALMASVALVYAFAEEIGWRRYLQNALNPLHPSAKYLLIGAVWWLWHFRFDTAFDLVVFPLICLGGGYLLGRLADDTRSLLPVVAMHSLVTLTTTTGSFGVREIAAIALVFSGWFVIERLWLHQARCLADGRPPVSLPSRKPDRSSQ